MENILLKMITDENENLVPEKIKSLCPTHLYEDDHYKFTMALISRTPLTDSFMEKHFKELRLPSLLFSNYIPEHLFVENMREISDIIGFMMMRKVIRTKELLVFELIADSDYSEETYEKFLSMLMKDLMSYNPKNKKQVRKNRDKTTVNLANHVLQRVAMDYFVKRVSKEFIMSSDGSIIFDLLIAFKLDDRITEKDLLGNMYRISYKQISNFEESLSNNQIYGMYDPDIERKRNVMEKIKEKKRQIEEEDNDGERPTENDN